MNDLAVSKAPDIIQLDDIPPYETQDYDIYDEKDFRKYIDDIKKIVRGSLEYREYIQYLRKYMNMDRCSFFENVNNQDTFKIKIEIHHSPYTLEDIVLTVFNKRVFYHEGLDPEEVAKEVMYIHYFLIVGLIPLSETVHKLVHNQLLFIPTNKVGGNYKEFENAYCTWIPEETKTKIKACEDRTLLYDFENESHLLEQKQIPIDFDDNQISNLQLVSDNMQMRLEEIKRENSRALCDNMQTQLIRGVTYDDEISYA